MEENKPLESPLTHTSKEPEAQVWAQIGTKSYDPLLQSSDKTTKPKEESPSKKPTSQENGTPGNVSQGKEGTDSPEEVIDVGNSESEKLTSEEAQKAIEKESKEKSKELPKSKSFTLGDGFVEPVAETETKTKDSSKGKESKDKAKRSTRSRSRSRERKRSPSSKDKDKYNDYTTNSSMPEDIKSRVFVGHLNTDKCEKTEVDELFRPFGKILGVNMQNGYGFVQYEEEKSVKEAIKHLHGTVFKDEKLVVDRPVAMRKLEASSRRRERSSRELMDELEYYRRREREYRRHDDVHDRRRDWDRDYRGRPPMPPPLLPPQPPLGYYGDYMERDRYGGRDMGYGRYGEEPRYRDDRYRDDPYRGDDRYPARDPYDYSFNQRANPYGDQYGKPPLRRM